MVTDVEWKEFPGKLVWETLQTTANIPHVEDMCCLIKNLWHAFLEVECMLLGHGPLLPPHTLLVELLLTQERQQGTQPSSALEHLSPCRNCGRAGSRGVSPGLRTAVTDLTIEPTCHRDENTNAFLSYFDLIFSSWIFSMQNTRKY